MTAVRAIGRRIRRARKRAGLSLPDVVELAAAAAGVDIDLDVLLALERGEGPAPETAALRALSSALNLGGDELTAGTQYISPSSQALLQVVEELALTPLEPRTLSALTDRLAEPRDRVYRALVNLDAAGWAEQTPAGSWRLTPHVAQISERLRLALHDVHRRYLGVA